MNYKVSHLVGEMFAFRTTHFQIFSQQIKVNNAGAADKRENSSELT